MDQLAIDTDQDGLEHPLQGEEAYFDGCHSRCVGYNSCIICLPYSHALYT